MAHCSDILIIADDAALGDFLREALSDEGYTVRVIPAAPRIDAAIIAGMPSLVLCDLPMPGRFGRDLIMQVQYTLPADVPIVVMSADSHTARALDDLNIAFCLIKPFDLDALFACVAAHIRVAATIPQSRASGCPS